MVQSVHETHLAAVRVHVWRVPYERFRHRRFGGIRRFVHAGDRVGRHLQRPARHELSLRVQAPQKRLM